MTRDDVQAWVDAYVRAWRTYDPADIAALFTGDATYAYHPWDEGEAVLRGRDSCRLARGAGPARLVGGTIPAADGRGRSSGGRGSRCPRR